MTTSTCPSCGKSTGGKFCRHCGAAAASASGGGCARCGAALATGARFCAQCGSAAAAGGSGGSSGERLRWFLAGGATVAVAGALVLVLSRSPSSVAAAAMPVAATATGEAGGLSAAELAAMSPRERFDRLYNRIMRSSESGDEASVATFAPMALQAYRMLDTVDADARYHAALIHLHTGGVEAAAALGDSILQGTPGHLFGYIVKGTLARFQQDQPALQRAYRDFLAHYDAEQRANRREYGEHPRALADFRTAAEGARGGTTP